MPRCLDIVYPSFFTYYKCGMPISKGSSSTNIRFRKFESSNSRLELYLTASVGSFGKDYLRELVQLVTRGGCLIRDDNIAYNRSFA